MDKRISIVEMEQFRHLGSCSRLVGGGWWWVCEVIRLLVVGVVAAADVVVRRSSKWDGVWSGKVGSVGEATRAVVPGAELKPPSE